MFEKYVCIVFCAFWTQGNFGCGDCRTVSPVEHKETREAYKEMEEKLQNLMHDQIGVESSCKDLKACCWHKISMRALARLGRKQQ
jgi:hypothetical protein